MYVIASARSSAAATSPTRCPVASPGAARTIGVNPGWSTIVDPDGQLLAGPLIQEEGILTAGVDAKVAGAQRYRFDPLGHYRRPDVFRLVVNEAQTTGGLRVASGSVPAKLTRDDPIEQRAPEIVKRLSEAYADAKVALRFSNALECLVATILSAQCTDEKVNEVTATLFRKYRTAEDYLSVPEDELKADIKPTGFFNQKATAIREASRRIVEAYGGEVPGTMEDLITLRGVARKTANIVLGNAFGIVEGIAVDTHVKRVGTRLGFTVQKDPDKVEKDLIRLVPQDRWFHFTYVLIDHGRAICVAKKPKCPECLVEPLCPASQA